MVYRLAAAGMSRMLPMIGTPMSDIPCTEVSSSNTATGINPASGWRIISRTADAASSRLPTIATRNPLPREPRCQAKIRDWKRIKLMPRVARITPIRSTSACTT